MPYILSKLISKFESKDPNLPVVVTDVDELIDDGLISEFEKAGWKPLVLESRDDEFFIMLEAEKLKKDGKKVVVIVKAKDFSHKDFVHLAEYYDRGNNVDLYAKKFARELGINTKEYQAENIVELLKIGQFKDEKWWKRISKEGIDAVFEELENRVWDLIKNPALWKNINEAERNFIVTKYLPLKFGLEMRKNLKPVEIANRLSEDIFESYFIDEPSDGIKNFYEKWEDSKEMENSLFEYAKKFEETHMDELIKNINKVISRDTQPFLSVEREIFKRKIDEFLDTKDRKCLEFAKARSEFRDAQRDMENEVYWNEFAQLDVIFEKKDLSTIDSLEGIIKAYQDFIWKFDRLDRILENSHLPSKLIEWARKEIDETLHEANLVWSKFYDPKEHELTDQAGFLRKVLQENGKQAVVVVDALRYELAASIAMKNPGIESDIRAVIAMTPTVTPIGMGSLFSSGKIRKERNGKSFFVVDDETGKKISDVKSREENIKKLVEDVKIYPLGKIPSKLGKKLILMSRDVDEAGHDELLRFISEEILNEISKTIKELVAKGYTVHMISDHGFCLLNDDRISEEKDEAFHSSGRYKIVNKAPQNAKYEEVGNGFIVYADYGNTFEKNGIFFHGGISIQEVLIPHVVFEKKASSKKISVSISGKENLKVLRKKRVDIVLYGENRLFVDKEPRRVYIEVKNERFDLKKPIQNGEKIVVPISFEASDKEKFTVDVYDADDGSHLDYVEVTYLPMREEDLF